ncbi:N-acetylneuraminate synthase family protein [Flavobacterium cyclinae]|uniref:N-acetylneuraminate synthase family protein n=1 Tax=Flavobacterium cyclinae TaxID=2895947 RepID=UPI001E46B16C|nr:N-acetylneuraminate synthase family protein [Flavobacterium cyclinae]UGS20603.1 N-acetylneuraminate synthase family protein [Flavobacterium cyclinae]
MERDTKINSPFHGKFGPLLIAEIGGNHEGDFEYAKKLTQLAIDTNVDYVKFQIYTGDTLVSQLESPDRNKHFKKFELTKDNHIYLAEMVKEAGILYTSSVWDIDAMTWLDKYISLYKIGSGDLTAYSVLKKTAEKGKPIIVSTGLSSEDEVLKTIEYIQSINSDYKSSEMLAVLQCTSMYPIPSADANLNVMKRLKELTNLTIGYSDHTEGSKALNYAVAIGAEILEFHFTDSREGKQFRDHKVSLTPSEINELIQEIQLINELKGNSVKKPVTIEIENGHVESFRRAVYPSKDIKAGEVLTENNLTVLRPNHGIDARDFDKLIGKTIIKDVIKHQKLNWNLIE